MPLLAEARKDRRVGQSAGFVLVHPLLGRLAKLFAELFFIPRPRKGVRVELGLEVTRLVVVLCAHFIESCTEASDEALCRNKCGSGASLLSLARLLHQDLRPPKCVKQARFPNDVGHGTLCPEALIVIHPTLQKTLLQQITDCLSGVFWLDEFHKLLPDHLIVGMHRRRYDTCLVREQEGHTESFHGTITLAQCLIVVYIQLEWIFG
mmetsp:Transcript_7361/g.13833  ORF Transcript_7361/g.13833 Transcript_7361/m.13833 type:complete len:207 (+) Transcript_7361:882-1502(+)